MSTGQPAPSNALVFFGATGDLAYKKIFPALQSMARRGRLDVPVIGVAKSGWTRDQLVEGGAVLGQRGAKALGVARQEVAGLTGLVLLAPWGVFLGIRAMSECVGRTGRTGRQREAL